MRMFSSESPYASDRPSLFRPHAGHLRFPRIGGPSRAELRVCEWLSRYRERRGNGDLHKHAQSHTGGCLVGHLESDRRAGLIGPCRLRHRGPFAGRAGPQYWLGSRFCNGLLPAHFRHHLECRHLVFGSSSLELPHTHRLDPRRRSGQLIDGSLTLDDGRRQLGQGAGCGAGADDLAGRRVLHRLIIYQTILNYLLKLCRYKTIQLLNYWK